LVNMSDDLTTRRRRAAYRASHRGSKEMDIALGRYAAATLPSMSAAMLEVFERLLGLPDPELQDMIWRAERCQDGEVAELIARLRAFHGLGAPDR
jgi:antitoxin CptB